MDYSSLIAGALGGLLGSFITALVSIFILRKQFIREEKTLRESRASELMETIESSVWIILNGHIYKYALDEKYNDEFYSLPSIEHGSARSDLHNIISKEKMNVESRIQDADRKLIQQKALIELFIGEEGLNVFNDLYDMVPQIKDALTEYISNRNFQISLKIEEIKSIRPDVASNWSQYLCTISRFRDVLLRYTNSISFWKIL